MSTVTLVHFTPTGANQMATLHCPKCGSSIGGASSATCRNGHEPAAMTIDARSRS